MELHEFRHSLIVLLFVLLSSVECVRNVTSNHTIGFESFHHIGASGNHSTAGRKPMRGLYYTTPPPTQQPITTINPPQPKIRKPTTIAPTHVTTFQPPSTRKPPPTKSPKPKATHPTTKKVTVPTLPPSIYVKPSITKVVLPPRTNQEMPTTNWNLFHKYLQNFTSKAEHTKEPIYRANKGDTFTYYYEIANYYQNAHKASSFYKVQANNIRNCANNTSKIMCLPNTNALCLTNGTIMCVTHLSATVSCVDGYKHCAITYLPCNVLFQTCADNKFYAGVPCVSNVLLQPSSDDFYRQITMSSIEYCVTSVIQPKKLYSAVGPLFSILMSAVKKQYEMLSDNILRYNNVWF